MMHLRARARFAEMPDRSSLTTLEPPYPRKGTSNERPWLQADLSRSIGIDNPRRRNLSGDRNGNRRIPLKTCADAQAK